MGLDTKYRPTRYQDVVGQQATVTILRQIVKSGAGLSQSYLFGGPWGSGKTTLARILAKTLLCYHPVEGEACRECLSCREMEDGISPNFVEVDAATHSGKADVTRLLETLPYDEHAQRRCIYLWDECHALSKEAEDAMLKPMEENRPGTDQKRLVNIFCTTEPESVRNTILSRCAPAFRIQIPPTEAIVDRLVFVCDSETLLWDREGLELLVLATKGHFRDALKALSSLSSMGRITRDLVSTYVGADLDLVFVEILESLQTPAQLGPILDRLLGKISPSSAYRQLSDFCLDAFQVSVGFYPTTVWRKESLEQAGKQGSMLLHLADRLGSRPSTVSRATLLCDLLLSQRDATHPTPPISLPARPGPWTAPTKEAKIIGGAYMVPEAVKPRSGDPPPSPKPTLPSQTLSVPEFEDRLKKRLEDLKS